MSRSSWRRSRWSRWAPGGLLLLCLGAPGGAIGAGLQLAEGLRVEVVASAIPRPVQLALDGTGGLVVLSHGWRGDAAGEIYHIDLRGPWPADAGRVRRLVVPFSGEARKSALGSLAVDPRSGELFLGEENGNRIYRLTADRRLVPLVVGLNHLLGGSSIALDPAGRLVFLDYVSPETHLRSESPLPPSLRWLTDEAYRGPLVFRIDPAAADVFPRRTDLLTPIFPKGVNPASGVEPEWTLIAVAAAPAGELVLLSSIGELLRLTASGELRRVGRLPPGHYHRTSMALGPDGSVYVSAGFHIRHVYRVHPAGRVESVARDLGDPGGLVVDGDALYVAETALHRIIRILPIHSPGGEQHPPDRRDPPDPRP